MTQTHPSFPAHQSLNLCKGLPIPQAFTANLCQISGCPSAHWCSQLQGRTYCFTTSDNWPLPQNLFQFFFIKVYNDEGVRLDDTFHSLGEFFVIYDSVALPVDLAQEPLLYLGLLSLWKFIVLFERFMQILHIDDSTLISIQCFKSLAKSVIVEEYLMVQRRR